MGNEIYKALVFLTSALVFTGLTVLEAFAQGQADKMSKLSIAKEKLKKSLDKIKAKIKDSGIKLKATIKTSSSPAPKTGGKKR